MFSSGILRIRTREYREYDLRGEDAEKAKERLEGVLFGKVEHEKNGNVIKFRGKNEQR